MRYVAPNFKAPPKNRRPFFVQGHEVEDWLNVTRTGISLGLLPSGPDPIGEWHVHKPVFQKDHIMGVAPKCKGKEKFAWVNWTNCHRNADLSASVVG